MYFPITLTGKQHYIDQKFKYIVQIVKISFQIQFYSMVFSHVYLYRLFVQCSSAHK